MNVEKTHEAPWLVSNFRPQKKYHLFYVSLPQVEAFHLQKYSFESVVFRWRIVSIRILRKPALDCVASLISRAK